MTSDELDALIEGLAPAVKGHVDLTVSSLLGRIEALETKAANWPTVLHGKDGQQGEKGLDGAAGRDGRDGVDGKDGADGAQGPQGETGPSGAPGEKGMSGADGAPGRDGRDGLPGVQGEKGIDGKDGDPGPAGVNGRDGTFENIKILYDGERTVTFCFKNGDPIEGGTLVLPTSIYRGLWVEGKSYDRGDQVTWGGAQWNAMSDTSSKPGEASPQSRAWVLSVKRGAEGKKGIGSPGPQGPRGEKGDPGPARW